MSNRVIPAGSINPNATIAPGVLILESLTPGSIAGIPTNLGGVVGSSTYGPVDAPTNVSDPVSYATQFGNVTQLQYDMGTLINAAYLQGITGSYVCVRVTDGTDTAAVARLLDVQSVPETGAVLTAKYSGTTGNTFQTKITLGNVANAYTLTISRPDYASEIYSNIPAPNGATFWTNLISAVNNGQSGLRGPSNLVIASSSDGVGGITITTPGSYTSIPLISFTGGGGGSGAAASAVMYALSATVATSQSGAGSYAPGDTITYVGGTGAEPVTTVTHTQVASATITAGGTGGTPGTQTVTGTTGTGTKFQASVTVSGGGVITAILSVAVAGDYTVNPSVLTAEPVTGASLSGATLNIKMGVLTSIISTPGALTALASNPVAQGTTSGTGTGYTATLAYGVLNANITNHGLGYTVPPTVVFASGAAIGTASLGSTSLPTTTISLVSPFVNPYHFTGGTDGTDGLTGSSLLGTNTAIPTGMYALGTSDLTAFALVGNDDQSTFSEQDAFASESACQAVVVGPPGQTAAAAITAKAGATLFENTTIYLVGDWCYFLDVNNNGIIRLISPQCYYLGLVTNLPPQASTLNKPLRGIVATQKSQMNQIYSDADITSLMQNGIDVIGAPSSGGNYFSPQTGKSCGTDLTINNMYIQRMANFLAISLDQGGILGAYVGDMQTPDIRIDAKNAIVAFLKNLESNQQIETSQVILDATNNPDERVQLGFMQATVSVQLFSVIIVFLVNLNVGTSALQSITPVTPPPAI